jgi:hypothetical protein
MRPRSGREFREAAAQRPRSGREAAAKWPRRSRDTAAADRARSAAVAAAKRPRNVLTRMGLKDSKHQQCVGKMSKYILSPSSYKKVFFNEGLKTPTMYWKNE